MTAGAPSIYTEELAEYICAQIADGKSLRQIDGAALTTIMRWANEKPEFRDQYARAMVIRADRKFEELDDVSEKAALAKKAVTVQGLRLKADNIKWMIARMNSKKYGDRTVVAGDPGAPLTTKLDMSGITPEQLRVIASLNLPEIDGESS